MDFSDRTYFEMRTDAWQGHPTAIDWMWWRHFLGLWRALGFELHLKKYPACATIACRHIKEIDDEKRLHAV